MVGTPGREVGTSVGIGDGTSGWRGVWHSCGEVQAKLETMARAPCARDSDCANERIEADIGLFEFDVSSLRVEEELKLFARATTTDSNDALLTREAMRMRTL